MEKDKKVSPEIRALKTVATRDAMTVYIKELLDDLNEENRPEERVRIKLLMHTAIDMHVNIDGVP